ncbi:hypothetical protein [uncultured Halopseudomonas sp.]|uniref:YgaP family membrane protein n=1 Tax=uncultured Halopseudomonas sp. TaxID=2901193 RepID=UPI0030EC921A|tara:strand:- start:8070 stop:8465 length:396 start_codon:yes stop_codon:yes gene_type:complete
MQQSSKSDQPLNVEGFERFASVAGGLVLLGKGVRRGGLLGILQFAAGAMVLARGASGRCELKKTLAEPVEHEDRVHIDIERYSHMPMDSEVHSSDFEGQDVSMPDSTQMGNEARADRQSEIGSGNQGKSSS